MKMLVIYGIIIPKQYGWQNYYERFQRNNIKTSKELWSLLDKSNYLLYFQLKDIIKLFKET